MSMLRALVPVGFVALTAAAAVATAAADGGGPSPGLAYGGGGIVGPGGTVRYVTLPTERGTLLEQLRVGDGNVLRWTLIPRPLAIPYVTNDGATSGLSRDLRTLVLASYTNAAVNGSTRFAVVELRRFKVTQWITLRGMYAFDAIAPDASTMYLIQYTSAQNWNRYRVRAYDLRARRLLADPIVDKREAGEAMTGWPVTRATGGDGRWVYTLYSRVKGSPFVHALDTRGRAAVCIDLPWHGSPNALTGIRMRLDGDRLVLTKRRAVLATVNVSTLSVASVRVPTS
jgi:hypothetical protein